MQLPTGNSKWDDGWRTRELTMHRANYTSILRETEIRTSKLFASCANIPSAEIPRPRTLAPRRTRTDVLSPTRLDERVPFPFPGQGGSESDVDVFGVSGRCRANGERHRYPDHDQSIKRTYERSYISTSTPEPRHPLQIIHLWRTFPSTDTAITAHLPPAATRPILSPAAIHTRAPIFPLPRPGRRATRHRRPTPSRSRDPRVRPAETGGSRACRGGCPRARRVLVERVRLRAQGIRGGYAGARGPGETNDSFVGRLPIGESPSSAVIQRRYAPTGDEQPFANDIRRRGIPIIRVFIDTWVLPSILESSRHTRTGTLPPSALRVG
jgi:hypothetical protein